MYKEAINPYPCASKLASKLASGLASNKTWIFLFESSEEVMCPEAHTTNKNAPTKYFNFAGIL